MKTELNQVSDVFVVNEVCMLQLTFAISFFCVSKLEIYADICGRNRSKDYWMDMSSTVVTPLIRKISKGIDNATLFSELKFYDYMKRFIFTKKNTGDRVLLRSDYNRVKEYIRRADAIIARRFTFPIHDREFEVLCTDAFEDLFSF